jgi:hypothetical protein
LNLGDWILDLDFACFGWVGAAAAIGTFRIAFAFFKPKGRQDLKDMKHTQQTANSNAQFN